MDSMWLMRRKLRHGLLVATALGLGAMFGSHVHARTIIRIESDVTYCGPQSLTCRITVACPSGLVVWGGGVGALRAKVVATWPSATAEWSAIIQPARLEYGDDVVAAAYGFVNCSEEPPGYEIVRGNRNDCAALGEPCAASLQCATPKVALGGGVDGVGSHFESIYPSEPAEWSISWFRDGEGGKPGPGSAWQYVICADSAAENPIIKRGAATQCGEGDTKCGGSVRCTDGVAFAAGILGGQSKIRFLDTYRDQASGGWYRATWEYGSDAAGYGTPVAMCTSGEMIVDVLLMDGFE